MKQIINILALCMLVTFLQCCKEEGRLDYLDSSSTIPKQVSEVKVKNTPGGAIITYKIPTDESLSYVKAVYETQTGTVSETKSSIYSDTLVVNGFGDTNKYTVKLYSVGKNEKVSEPISVDINPLTPPVISALKKLTMRASFGGVKINLENELKADLAIVLMADTTGKGYFSELQTFYSKAPSVSFSYRGMVPVQRKFKVYLRDRWNNKSDAIIADLTPLFEELVPKPFILLTLPGDTNTPVTTGYSVPNIWDGLVNVNIFASPWTSKMPQWFTFDLKTNVVLSRLKEHQRGSSFTYTGSNVKAFELWGSNNPDSDGGWKNWVLLGKFNSFKPSGLPLGQMTADDYAYGFTNGEDFEIDSDTYPAAKNPVRYLRFKTTETYGGGVQVTIGEVTFWGQIIK